MEIEEEEKESKNGRKKNQQGKVQRKGEKNVLILKRAEEKRENSFVFFY